MKTSMMLALSLTVAATPSIAAPSKPEHVGDLICSVGDASPKAGMLCVYSNKTQGREEAYQGSLANAGAGSFSSRRTLLWTVNAKTTVDLRPGVLAQRYEAPESEQKKAKSVEGDEKPDVSLSL